ncbi:YceI family protein [bacterium]|jgi:polyisoprenoid-binding protein YceI|nr:YceI family protein [bacterium]
MIKKIVIAAVIAMMGSSIYASTYTIDASHSDVGFSVKHLGISKVRGQFKTVTGTIDWDKNGKSKNTKINGNIVVKSLSTQNEKRDGHLISADFFDADNFPAITFTSKKVEMRMGKTVVKGDLSIHGVTKEVSIPVEFAGPVSDPWGNEKIGVDGELTINRTDYGLTWNKTLDKGGLLIGEDVKISISIEATKVK